MDNEIKISLPAGEPLLIVSDVELQEGRPLVVMPGQEAVVVYKGLVMDHFECGVYYLRTEHLPLLTNHLDLGRLPDTLKADLWYVDVSEEAYVKWGTPHPVAVTDPQYGIPVNIRAYGQSHLVVSDLAALTRHLLKSRTSNEQTATELLRQGATTRLAAQIQQTVATTPQNLLTLDERRDEWAGHCGQALAMAMLPGVSWGKTALEHIGLMPDVGQRELQQLQQPADETQTAAQPAAGPQPSGEQYFLAINNQQQGPYTYQQVSEWVANNLVQGQTLCWHNGMPGWQPLAQQPEFAQYFGR